MKTIEDGIHTYDIFKEGISKQKVGTQEFAVAVIANLGQKPSTLKTVSYAGGSALKLPKYVRKTPAKKELVGADIFVHWAGTDPNELAKIIKAIETEQIELTMITNRGIKVWPEGFKETFCTDHWRCRFKPRVGQVMKSEYIPQLLQKSLELGINTIKTENLYHFDGKIAYALGQGQ